MEPVIAGDYVPTPGNLERIADALVAVPHRQVEEVAALELAQEAGGHLGRIRRCDRRSASRRRPAG
jgi:hypothetical protein